MKLILYRKNPKNKTIYVFEKTDMRMSDTFDAIKAAEIFGQTVSNRDPKTYMYDDSGILYRMVGATTEDRLSWRVFKTGGKSLEECVLMCHITGKDIVSACDNRVRTNLNAEFADIEILPPELKLTHLCGETMMANRGMTMKW